MTPTTFDRKALLQTILDQFRLDRDGDHGPAHWARVRKHAMTIGRARGADLLVVELFSFLHDSQRENEFTDTDHGERAAAYAESLNRSHYIYCSVRVHLVSALFHVEGRRSIHLAAKVRQSRSEAFLVLRELRRQEQWRQIHNPCLQKTKRL